MATCYKGGYVVAARYVVPDDPTIVGVHDDRDPTGCSRISCYRCGAIVRQTPRLRPRRRPKDPAAIWRAEDWSTLRALEPDDHGRLYVCKCEWHVEVNWELLGDNDKFMAPTIWSCGGHPDASDAMRA